MRALSNMNVSDVMSRHIDFVASNTKVQAVALLIFGRGVNGVPVCKGRKIIGFITERDILSKFYPSMEEYVQDPVHEGNFEVMEEKINEVFSLPAEKIMSKNPASITPDTPLLHAHSLMLVNKIGRLPVVDKKGNLVGIISKGDIFKALVGNKLLLTADREYNDWLSKTYYAAVDIHDRMEHEIPDLVKVFHENNVKNIFDVGCGTGDHVIALANKGFITVGVDRSKAMINEANTRKKIIPKEEQGNIKFIAGETINIISKQKTTFDAILFMGNTLSHNVGEIERI